MRSKLSIGPNSCSTAPVSFRRDSSMEPISGYTNTQRGETPTVMMNMKKKTKPKQKTASIFKKFLPYTKLGIGIVMTANVCMLLALAWTLIRNTIDKGATWQLSQEPVNAEFEKFSVSSTSELCNEYARSYYIEGMRVELISTFMMLCLSIAEPQGSGIGGSSIVVFANKSHCLQSTGNARFPKKLSPFVRELTKIRKAEWTGSYASAIPGDLRSYLFFATLMMGRSEREHIQIMLEKLIFDFDELNLPVSRRLSDTLKKWSIDTNMFARKQFPNFLTEDGMHLNEGDTFRHNFDVKAMHALMMDFNGSVKATLFNELWREMNSVDRGYYVKNYIDIISNEKWIRDGFSAKMNDSDTTICSAVHTDIVTSDPLVPTVLSNIKKEDLGKEFWKKGFINILSSSKLFEWLSGLSDEVWKLAGDIAQRKLRSMTDSTRRLLEELGKMEETEYDVPSAGNSFVVVDYEHNTASAMSATLGTGFGSLVTQMGEKTAVVLNNMMAGAGRNFSTEADLRHVQEPVIVIKNGKIRTAYASNGGFISRALEVPRKLTSLALSLLADIPLTSSLTTPLFYKDRKDHLVATNNFPSLRYGTLARNKKKDKLPKKHNLPDTVVAIDKQKAIYFNGWENGYVAIPNGF